jgi:hypothetical protein
LPVSLAPRCADPASIIRYAPGENLKASAGATANVPGSATPINLPYSRPACAHLPIGLADLSAGLTVKVPQLGVHWLPIATPRPFL